MLMLLTQSMLLLSWWLVKEEAVTDLETHHLKEFKQHKRLIGFPDDFEFTKTKNSQNLVKGNAVVTGEEAEAFSGNHEDSRNTWNPQFLTKRIVTSF
ncbi:hypothetical protein H5410_057427 [Solanum commersonii]|uniref:Uncharacterized protein n=1 Tax=Solanum commersonii TaxID=4109 RepID=A0A9J5WPN6_SOLCO|nr:hypothetical protein H5410_057427 [Solanum commersonii]